MGGGQRDALSTDSIHIGGGASSSRASRPQNTNVGDVQVIGHHQEEIWTWHLDDRPMGQRLLLWLPLRLRLRLPLRLRLRLRLPLRQLPLRLRLGLPKHLRL